MIVIRKIELYAAALAVVALVLTSLTIILLRMFSTSAWSVGVVDTLSQYPSHFMVVAALLGGSIAMSRGETLKIEVLNSVMGKQAQVMTRRIVALLGFVFFGVFIALAVRYLTIDYRPVVAYVYLPLMVLLWLKILAEVFVKTHKPLHEI